MFREIRRSVRSEARCKPCSALNAKLSRWPEPSQLAATPPESLSSAGFRDTPALSRGAAFPAPREKAGKRSSPEIVRDEVHSHRSRGWERFSCQETFQTKPVPPVSRASRVTLSEPAEPRLRYGRDQERDAESPGQGRKPSFPERFPARKNPGIVSLPETSKFQEGFPSARKPVPKSRESRAWLRVGLREKFRETGPFQVPWTPPLKRKAGCVEISKRSARPSRLTENGPSPE